GGASGGLAPLASDTDAHRRSSVVVGRHRQGGRPGARDRGGIPPGLHAEPAHVAADESRAGLVRPVPRAARRGRAARRPLPCPLSLQLRDDERRDLREVGRCAREHRRRRVRDRRGGRRLPHRLPSRRGVRRRARTRPSGARARARPLQRRDVAPDRELGRRRRHDRPLGRGARDGVRASRPAPPSRALPRLVPPLRLGRRRHRRRAARHAPRRGRRGDRARPSARAPRERQRSAARLEPRPPREHRRGSPRREARRVPRKRPAAGPAGRARGGRPAEQRPGCRRDPEDEGAVGTRYRWVILAAGTLAQASFSALSVGLPALAPALRSHYRLSLGETGVVLGAVGIGMLFTLLPWGFLADRINEQLVIAVGLVLAAGSLVFAGSTTAYGPLVGALVAAGAFGASVNAASGRAVMGWFPADQRGLALGVRQTAIPIGGAAAAAALPWLADAGGTKLAFVVLGCSCLAGAVVALAFIRT